MVQRPESSQISTNRRNSSFRKFSDAEIEERRRRGLCFRCDETFSPGHICKNRHLHVLLMGEDEKQMEGVEAEIALQVNAEQALQFQMGSVAGMKSQKSLKLWGELQGKRVMVLVNSGASHNFISQELVQQMGITVDQSLEYVVQVGDGYTTLKQGVCRGVELQLPNVKVTETFYLFDLSGVDVVLGYEWLESLGRIEADFKDHVMWVMVEGKKVEIRSQVVKVHGFDENHDQRAELRRGGVLCGVRDVGYAFSGGKGGGGRVGGDVEGVP